MKLKANEQAIVEKALAILEKSMKKHGVALTSPSAVRDFLRLKLEGRKQEVFLALFLDAQHRVIAAEEMFHGTLTQTSVYPREVLRAALEHNAAALIVAHNHPSGIPMPSQADQMLTKNLREALTYIDVDLLDHFIVGERKAVSMAEMGLMQMKTGYAV